MSSPAARACAMSLLVGESLIVALSGGAIGCVVAFGLFKVFALNVMLQPIARS